MAPRLYESGPRVGQVIQEYPKMLYDKAGNYRKVKDEAEHRAASKEGWLTIGALRESQEREKEPAPPQEPIRRGPGRPPLRRF